MKNKLLLISSFFLCLACSQPDILVKNDQTKPSATTITGKNNGSTGARTIGRSYTVENKWAAPEWTFKGDFNGDKKWDIISLYGTQAYVKLSQGLNASSYLSQTWYTNGSYTGYTFVGDFNGDGYSDIASANGGNVIMKINNKNGTFSNQNWAESNQWGSKGYTVVGDFNNDGKADIASANGSNTYIHLSTGSGFQSVNWPTDGQYGASGWTYAADFTGDGKCDIISIDPNNGLIYLKQNTGNGFTSSRSNTSRYDWGDKGVWVGNIFGYDNKAHVYSADVYNIYDRFWVSSTSPSWYFEYEYIAGNWGSLGYQFVEDFDGDGTDELISCIGGQIYVH